MNRAWSLRRHKAIYIGAAFMANRGDSIGNASGFVEDPSGIRHYLLCLGIDIPGDTSRGSRSAAVPVGSSSLLNIGHRALRLDVDQGHAQSWPAAVGRSNSAWSINLPRRLRLPVLG